jgi:transposase-like protein
MKRRRWDTKTKAMIVLQGLKGKPINDLCIEHQIGQTQYYRWRDQFLANMHQVFDGKDRKEVVLKQENLRLRKVIGDLTVELKKSEEEWPR